MFSGGGTGEEVARELGYNNSIHLDLINGWDALKDEIPTYSDFVFSHPPYFDIIDYNKQRGSYNEDELSNKMPYDDFIAKLDLINKKIYASLINGGRHAILIGDVRKKGKYYSIIKDMTWFGDLENHIIKVQHNVVSSNKIYKGNLIRIAHEHLLVFKKNMLWEVPIKFTKDFVKDIRLMVNVTWHDLIRTSLEFLGNKADLKTIYKVLNGCAKAKQNIHWKEKIRQILQTHADFEKVGRGVYRIL